MRLDGMPKARHRTGKYGVTQNTTFFGLALVHRNTGQSFGTSRAHTSCKALGGNLAT